MTKKTERFDVTLLGRVIGSASGWDVHDTAIFGYYDFEPAKGVALPAGQAAMNFETGKFETYGDDGQVAASVDVISALAALKA